MAVSPIPSGRPSPLAQLAQRAVQRSDERSAPPSPGDGDVRSLDRGDQRIVEELERRDREVRAHEAAHKAAAGSLATGAPTFDTVVGPNGRRYAVGGEVRIDTSAVRDDPEATLRKAARIRAAALAPADPSAQDRRVAADAAALAREAQSDLVAERAPERSEGVSAVESAPSREDARESSRAEEGPAPLSPASRGDEPEPRLGSRIDLRA